MQLTLTSLTNLQVIWCVTSADSYDDFTIQYMWPCQRFSWDLYFVIVENSGIEQTLVAGKLLNTCYCDLVMRWASAHLKCWFNQKHDYGIDATDSQTSVRHVNSSVSQCSLVLDYARTRKQGVLGKKRSFSKPKMASQVTSWNPSSAQFTPVENLCLLEESTVTRSFYLKG